MAEKFNISYKEITKSGKDPKVFFFVPGEKMVEFCSKNLGVLISQFSQPGNMVLVREGSELSVKPGIYFESSINPKQWNKSEGLREAYRNLVGEMFKKYKPLKPGESLSMSPYIYPNEKGNVVLKINIESNEKQK